MTCAEACLSIDFFNGVGTHDPDDARNHASRVAELRSPCVLSVFMVNTVSAWAMIVLLMRSCWIVDVDVECRALLGC